jgi:hypothetical protein
MAITDQSSQLAKRRAQHWIAGFANGSFLFLVFQRFWSWFSQFGGNIDMSVVEFAGLTNTDTVLEAAACTLYALAFTKPTTVATFVKGTDNATTCATNGSQDLSIKMNTVGEHCIFFPKGLTLTAGWTMRSNTTATGSTTTATADVVTGFGIFA